MLEHQREFACILAFDVPIAKDVREYADSLGVRIFEDLIIYHLFDMFTAYIEEVNYSFFFHLLFLFYSCLYILTILTTCLVCLHRRLFFFSGFKAFLLFFLSVFFITCFLWQCQYLIGVQQREL